MSDLLFHERIGICMQLADVSGSQLAKAVNIDPSLISRYRNGQRVPGSDISVQLAETLWSYIEKKECMKELSAYMKKRESKISEKAFVSWFISEDGNDDESAAEARSLLDAFDRYIKTAPVAPVPIDIKEFSHLINDENGYYLGEKGLQDGVIRFLGNVYLHTPREILLFSDQNMNWMVSDPDYAQVWASLMAGCIKSGVHIRIVHNINRGLSEMNQAIKSWLPLYMSGMVYSYYLRDSEHKTSEVSMSALKESGGNLTERPAFPGRNLFSHTVFLCPDMFAIQGWNAAGSEKNWIYNYYTDADHLSCIGSLFEGLFAGSAPLIYFPEECNEDEAVMSYDYSGMNIYIFDDRAVIKNQLAPTRMFAFEHPLMMRAFRSFGKELG